MTVTCNSRLKSEKLNKKVMRYDKIKLSFQRIHLFYLNSKTNVNNQSTSFETRCSKRYENEYKITLEQFEKLRCHSKVI